MNATLTKSFVFRGHVFPAGIVGKVESSVCSLETGDAEVHAVAFPGHVSIPVPAGYCRLHKEPTLPGTVTPEHRISYAIAALSKLISLPYSPAREAEIEGAVRELDLMWVQYREGRLPHLVDGAEVPF